jgi:hypothetical protein
LTTGAQPGIKSDEGIFAQWVGLLAAPLAWAAQMQALYTMVPWACQTGHRAALIAVSLAALAVALLGALVARRNWARVGRGEPGDEGGARGRTRFLAVAGLVTSAFFFLVVVAQGLATLILHPCMF